ncbi:MAG TPA: PAS domain-containing protein, partial [Chakrabartia sp.]|nr:PAS domain-containing protein [Chakrabartia sp.]
MGDGAGRRSALSGLPDGALLALVAVLALASAGVLLWAVRDWALAGGFAAAVIAFAGLGWLARMLWPARTAQTLEQDWAMVRAAADNDGMAIAVTDRTGRLVCANMLHESWFGGPAAPPALGFAEADTNQLAGAGKSAWRDGRARVTGLMRGAQRFDVDVVRSGRNEDHLLWRFRPAIDADLLQDMRDLVSGRTGAGMGESGIMMVLLDEAGKLMACNAAFALRATGKADTPCEGREFVSFLERDQHGQVRFAQTGQRQPALRMMQVMVDPDNPSGPVIILLLDEAEGGAGAAPLVSQIQTLLGELPLGLALADRDGRFIFLNDAFCRAVRLPSGSRPIYPGDLVVREDKGPVADAVRRFANGQAVSSDIAIRLRDQPEEPVALTIAGLRGMGDAAVLLSLKDNTEESRLKRQIAQASKMQAIGQLAGGVAHDFNNILTGILGHCDLMLMRHTPGESDYDDIQQIRSNANRAAALTRQLLAFSRQQTLRPQILQLPDVVSEISNLLKRLLGETVLLDVKHGRGLGAVRADPGQLEQVIVNLAVNARDAMPKGGTVTIQTFAVTKADVRDMGSDIMP